MEIAPGKLTELNVAISEHRVFAHLDTRFEAGVATGIQVTQTVRTDVEVDRLIQFIKTLPKK